MRAFGRRAYSWSSRTETEKKIFTVVKSRQLWKTDEALITIVGFLLSAPSGNVEKAGTPR